MKQSLKIKLYRNQYELVSIYTWNSEETIKPLITQNNLIIDLIVGEAVDKIIYDIKKSKLPTSFKTKPDLNKIFKKYVEIPLYKSLFQYILVTNTRKNYDNDLHFVICNLIKTKLKCSKIIENK